MEKKGRNAEEIFQGHIVFGRSSDGWREMSIPMDVQQHTVLTGEGGFATPGGGPRRRKIEKMGFLSETWSFFVWRKIRAAEKIGNIFRLFGRAKMDFGHFPNL